MFIISKRLCNGIPEYVKNIVLVYSGFVQRNYPQTVKIIINKINHQASALRYVGTVCDNLLFIMLI